MREQYPSLTLTQTKAINKLYDVEPDGFANGISTEKYVNLCRVLRATAYRELTALCELGVLVQTGTGRGRGTSSAPISASRVNKPLKTINNNLEDE
ncbi:hypothetical protein [Limnohabitans sp. 63ED37-2]|uniref:hypothetical protein n=1 Tax=Limnohabitans sp. 63ED37-2 TaxID=1678128 RepID=UPI000781C854|nr:hypothetical protein [Limnohabitans sp. 63ED37-2]